MIIPCNCCGKAFDRSCIRKKANYCSRRCYAKAYNSDPVNKSRRMSILKAKREGAKPPYKRKRRKTKKHRTKYMSEYNKEHRVNLTDYAVKQALNKQLGLVTQDITPELITLKREQLKLHRLIRERQ